MSLVIQSGISLLILLISLMTLLGYLKALSQAVVQLPRINSSEMPDQLVLPKLKTPTVSVIIPAFNEAENIEACVRSVLNSSQLSVEFLEVWVVDDQSTDDTLVILNTLQQNLADPRLKVLCGLQRPEAQIWTGKNWACYQAAQKATGEFLLFIDADVCLKPGAIAAVVQAAIAEQIDLLTCIPAVVCGSLLEWLVQPLIFINVLVAFNSKLVKNPNTKTTYALGPFLLFRNSTYRAIGGHQAIAGEIAEDVAFARKIKHGGFKLKHVLGPNLATLRMYRTSAALWEGWTKVLYVGAQRSLSAMGLLAFVMLAIYCVPWLGLILTLHQLFTAGTPLYGVELGLAGLAIWLQYKVRSIGSAALGTSTQYWWLQSFGGLLIAVMAIVSVIKAETGWGWTWRGRSLRPKKRR